MEENFENESSSSDNESSSSDNESSSSDDVSDTISVSFAQAIPDAREIIQNFNDDIDTFLGEEREQIDIHAYVENRSAGAFLPLFNMIRGLVDQIDHLSRGEAWDLAALLSDEIDALKSIINVLKSDLDAKNRDLEKLTLELGGKTPASPLNKLPQEIENKVRTFLGGRMRNRMRHRRLKYLFS
ncbi:MAG: hypothetical protein Ct9H90mP28_4420 [Paracoccaceae bacterium]|nr:MAG: hypothetical protein Ct9H90mP28_4420 [Paracoccaceae bacterium]